MGCVEPADSSSPLSWRDGSCYRSTVGCWPFLALVEVLENLSDVGEALRFIRWGLEAVKRVWWQDEDSIVDDNLSVGPAGWQTVWCIVSSVLTVYRRFARMEKTNVLAMVSKISCASLVTPFPFWASFFFISRMVCSSRALSASRSTFEMLGSAPSKPGPDSGTRSPWPTNSKLMMCAKGMMW